MKKLLFGTMLFATVFAFPIHAMAEVNVGVSISLPPPIVFASPPMMVVLPETYVYVVPDMGVDIFFYGGWWWRPWEGRWYRSRYYSSGWVYYQRVPAFYSSIPSGWRNDYRDRRWRGLQWNYQQIPQQQVQRNWSTWQKNKHWEKQQTWGVQGLKPRTRPQQPSKAVQQKPQQSRPESREVQPKQSRPQSESVQSERSAPQHRETPQQSNPSKGKPEKSQGKPEKGDDEKQDRKQDRQDRK